MTIVDPKTVYPASSFGASLSPMTQAIVFIDGEATREACERGFGEVSFADVCDKLTQFEDLAIVLLDRKKKEYTLDQLKASWPASCAPCIAGVTPEWGEPHSAENHGRWQEIRAFLLENSIMGLSMLILDPHAEWYPTSVQKKRMDWDEWSAFDQELLETLEMRLRKLGLSSRSLSAV